MWVGEVHNTIHRLASNKHLRTTNKCTISLKKKYLNSLIQDKLSMAPFNASIAEDWGICKVNMIRKQYLKAFLSRGMEPLGFENRDVTAPVSHLPLHKENKGFKVTPWDFQTCCRNTGEVQESCCVWMLLHPETPASRRYMASSVQDLWNQTRLFGPDSVWLSLYSIIYVRPRTGKNVWWQQHCYKQLYEGERDHIISPSLSISCHRAVLGEGGGHWTSLLGCRHLPWQHRDSVGNQSQAVPGSQMGWATAGRWRQQSKRKVQATWEVGVPWARR